MMQRRSARLSLIYKLGFGADWTLLHEAASHGMTALLKELLEGGGCVNKTSVNDATPLHLACLQAHTDCVKLLLEAGAEVNVNTRNGRTPLYNACLSGNHECVELLIQYGAEVNPSFRILTTLPLVEACLLGNAEIVRLLSINEARLESFDTILSLPLHISCIKRQIKCVKLLLKAGACVNSVNSYLTALHCAARIQRVDMIELLVEFGADVNAIDRTGKKPIDHTKPLSPSHLCLQFYQSNLLSLQHLCRISIWRMLTTRASKVIEQLDISQHIRRYLLHSNCATNAESAIQH